MTKKGDCLEGGYQWQRGRKGEGDGGVNMMESYIIYMYESNNEIMKFRKT
jgi:hypothetical protein